MLNDDSDSAEIPSFPGVAKMGATVLMSYLRPLVTDLGLSSILLFPSLGGQKQLSDGFDASKNPLLRVASRIKEAFPSLCLIADVCLCTFTETGHCCVFDDAGRMDNEKSVELLAKLSVAYAGAGFDVIAPSDMMDGRVGGIRSALNSAGFAHVDLLSYSSKFASCFYGPFRDAAGSAPKFGDRKCYQLPAGSRGLALRAAERDIREGASLVMVKPAMAYLDVVSSIAAQFPNFPVAVYQVSGEYTMLVEAAAKGVFQLQSVVTETLYSFKRAGASVIITYFTPQILNWIKAGEL